MVLSLSYNPMIRVGGVWTDYFDIMGITGNSLLYIYTMVYGIDIVNYY